MRQRKGTHIVIALLLAVVVTFIDVKALMAQDSTAAFDELEHIFKAYEARPSLAFNVEMKLYLKDQPESIIERLEATYAIDGRQRDFNFKSVEIISDSAYSLTINHDFKTIAIAASPKETNGGSSLFTFDRFQKLLKEAGERLSLNTEKNYLTAEVDNDEVDYLKLFYSPENYLLDHVEVYLRNSGDNDKDQKVLSLQYKNYKTAAAGNELQSVSQFVSINRKQVSLKDAYKSYKLINQL